MGMHKEVGTYLTMTALYRCRFFVLRGLNIEVLQ